MTYIYHWYRFLSFPAYTKVDCGKPKEIDHTLISYSTTTYKSQVTYTCEGGEMLKSACNEDHKWTPVVSSCKGNVNRFLLVSV